MCGGGSGPIKIFYKFSHELIKFGYFAYNPKIEKKIVFFNFVGSDSQTDILFFYLFNSLNEKERIIDGECM